MSYCFVGNIISETWLQPKSVEKGRRRESEQCHIAPWKAPAELVTKEGKKRSNVILLRVNGCC